jgi:hypothetical protein
MVKGWSVLPLDVDATSWSFADFADTLRRKPSPNLTVMQKGLRVSAVGTVSAWVQDRAAETI